MFALQARISTAVARALQTTLSPEEEKGLGRKPTGNLAAYEAFLKARDLQNRHGTSEPAQLREQRALLRETVALDPAFASAWARLAWTDAAANFWGFDQSYVLGMEFADNPVRPGCDPRERGRAGSNVTMRWSRA